MNAEQIKQAQESVIALEEFINTFNDLLANIDKTIEDKVQKALEGKSIPQTNIEDIIDERIKQNLSGFFKLAALQLENPPIIEQKSIETTSEKITSEEIQEEITLEEPKEDQKEETTEPIRKPIYYAGSPKRLKQQKIVMEVIKNYPSEIFRVKELTEILEDEHGIYWSNPTNELTAIMKKYPVTRVGYGLYKYTGE